MNNALTRKLIENHLVVILIFVGLTGIFTYPSYFESNKLIGSSDPYTFLNTFWWYHHNITNFNHFDLHWLFYNDYQFYPIGSPLEDLGSLNSYVSIFILPITGSLEQTYNLLIYAGFIFSGYGTFLLSRYLTNNYYGSLIAGIIFAYGTPHILQAHSHLGLASTEFIPFSILYLIKTSESNKIKYPIIGGFFLFLVFVTTFYYAIFIVFFLFAFVSYLIIKKEKLYTFSKIGLLLIVAVSFTAPFYYGHYQADTTSKFLGRDIARFTFFGTDLTSFFLPSNTTVLYSLHFPWENKIGTAESSGFLGYTALFLSLIAIAKTNLRKTGLWIISGSLLAIVSMGTFLKIYGINTEIPLPYYLLYNHLFFDLFSVPGRATIFVTLCVAILAAYGVNEILKIKLISFNKKILIVTILCSFIIVESLSIPFLPITDMQVPEIYNKIALDKRNIAILEAPIGRGDSSLQDILYGLNDYSTVYYQTIHGKPIYSGVEARVPEETQRYVQTYFLNQFIWDQTSLDIIKQDPKQVGISIFNYFNIGYIIIHRNVSDAYYDVMQDKINTTWLPQTKSTLYQIFSKSPDYEDNNLFAYVVPKSVSTTPFLVLGEGWSPFWNNSRMIGNDASLKIINPTNQTNSTDLNIDFVSILKNNLTFTLNGKNIGSVYVTAMNPYSISIRSLELARGTNELIIKSNQTSTSFPVAFDSSPVKTGLKTSLVVKTISIKPSNSKNTSFSIQQLNKDASVLQLSKYEEIILAYNNILKRNPTPHELDVYSSSLVNNETNYTLIEIGLKNLQEYKMLHP